MVELKELTMGKAFTRMMATRGPPTRLSLSKSNVIVGPNNSGKSNLLRIVRLLAESLPPSSKRPSEDEVFSNKPPVLSAELVFSNSEAKTLLDFLRVYRVRDAGRGKDLCSRLQEFRPSRRALQKGLGSHWVGPWATFQLLGIMCLNSN